MQQRALGWQAWATKIQDGMIDTLKADSLDTVTIIIKNNQYTLHLQPTVIVPFMKNTNHIVQFVDV